MTKKSKEKEHKEEKAEAPDQRQLARNLETVLQNTSGVSPELSAAAKALIASVGGSGLPK